MKKSKLFTKILLVALSLIMSLSAFACDNSENATDRSSAIPKYNGTHVMTAEKTDKYIVKDGASDYKVVVPVSQNSFEKTATQEFSYLFKKATNISLPVIRDEGLIHDKNNKYISIGNTSLMTQAELKGGYEVLHYDGCKIVTVGESIFIIGGSERGIIYGVYDFMNILFNFENFSIDAMYIDRNVSDVRLRNFNVIDIPDFKYRAGNNYQIKPKSSDYDVMMFGNRERVSGQRYDRFMPVKVYWKEEDIADPDKNALYANVSTNTASIMNPAMYPDKAQIWFSNRGNQWCYTARGIEEEWKEMTYNVAQIVIASLKANKDPIKNTITITQEDGSGAQCACKACSAGVEKYGGHAGDMCIFFNEVGRIVDEWMVAQKDEDAEFHDAYREDYHIIFFAYGFSLTPPTKKDADGNIVPIDEKVVLRDNLGTYLAFTLAGTDILSNPDSNNCYIFDAWSMISPYNVFWDYQANFQNAIYPHYPNYMNSTYYNWVAVRNDMFMFNELPGHTNGVPAFYDVNVHINMKMKWDVSLDINQLIDDYFKGVYIKDDVVEAMKDMYWDMRTYYTMLSEKLIVDINDSTPVTNKEYPQAVVAAWLNKADRARELAEKYKETDREAYDQMVRYIEMESLTPLWMLLDMYGKGLPPHVFSDYVKRIKSTLSTYNMTISLGYAGQLNAKIANM